MVALPSCTKPLAYDIFFLTTDRCLFCGELSSSPGFNAAPICIVCEAHPLRSSRFQVLQENDFDEQRSVVEYFSAPA